MKTKITRSSSKIILTTFLLIFATAVTFSANLINVTVSNIKFTPKDITIFVGDTVKWTDIEGTHNIDGTKASFPSNPESFGNSVDSVWVYTFVFNLPGFYNYKCDPHGNFGMTGTVTVEALNNINDMQILAGSDFNLYPNPANDYFIIDAGNLNQTDSKATYVLSDLNGNEILRFDSAESSQVKFDTKELTKGIYFINILKDGLSAGRKSVIIR